MTDALKLNTQAAIEALSDIYRKTNHEVMTTLGATVRGESLEDLDLAQRALTEAYLGALTTTLHAVGVSIAKTLLPQTAEEELATAERIRAEAASIHQAEVDSLNFQRFLADEGRKAADEDRKAAEEYRRDQVAREELRKIRGY